MVFPTPQIYTYHCFRHSIFLSQQLNIAKIRIFQNCHQTALHQHVILFLCFKTHLTMLCFFLNIAFFRLLLLQFRQFRTFLLIARFPPRLAPNFDRLGYAS